jgi:CheY-like chemotaxis protein
MMRKKSTTSVLIVDDSPVDLKLLQSYLQRQEGYELLEAVNGQEVLDRAKAQPDLGLILMDVQLPDVDGIEVCRQLKSDPATAQIPVVLISAVKMDDASIAAGLDAGADAYLTKPLEGPALRAWLKATLRISALQKALDTKAAGPPKDEVELLELFAKLSHAVNNPLQSIMAGADLMMLDLESDADAISALRDIQRNAEQIAELTAGASRLAKERLKNLE